MTQKRHYFFLIKRSTTCKISQKSHKIEHLGIIWQIQIMIMYTDGEIRVKINLSMCLKSEHHALNIYWKTQLYMFLTLIVDGDDGSPSGPDHLTPKEGVPSIQWAIQLVLT